MAGIENEDSTKCYRNAVLQSLVGLPALTRALATGNEPTNHDSRVIWLTLRQLASHAHPSPTLSLKPFQGVFQSYKGEFRAQRQQDAHHFFLELLDVLDQLRRKGAPSLGALHDAFFFHVHTARQCWTCGRVTHGSPTTENTLWISPRADMPRSVQALVSLAGEAHEVSKKCLNETCATFEKGDVRHYETTRWADAPEALVVGLKIFDEHGIKVPPPNDFVLDTTLHVRALTVRPVRYQLHAVVRHQGSDSIRSGHYVALRDGRVFSDAHTSLADRYRGGGTPYLLFYTRVREPRLVYGEEEQRRARQFALLLSLL